MQEEPPTLDEMIEQVEQLYQELLDQKFAPPLTMTERYRRQQQAGGEPYLQRLQRMREYNRRYYLGTLKQRRRRHAAASQPAASQPATSQPATSQPAASQPAASQPAASQPATSQPASNKFMLQL